MVKFFDTVCNKKIIALLTEIIALYMSISLINIRESSFEEFFSWLFGQCHKYKSSSLKITAFGICGRLSPKYLVRKNITEGKVNNFRLELELKIERF